jgi:hypothetical protein
MYTHTRAGALGFALWGLLHAVGGSAILIATLQDAAAGYASYPTATGTYDALSGAILAYFAYGLICLGLVALIVAWRGNLANNSAALALNTVMIVLVEIGLIVFLLIPGHVTLAQASIGFAFAAIGIIFGGIACTRSEAGHAAG